MKLWIPMNKIQPVAYSGSENTANVLSGNIFASILIWVENSSASKLYQCRRSPQEHSSLRLCIKICVCLCVCNSLVTVVIEAVVTAQCSQGAQSDGIGEKNLGSGINPHLKQTDASELTLLSSCVSVTLIQTWGIPVPLRVWTSLVSGSKRFHLMLQVVWLRGPKERSEQRRGTEPWSTQPKERGGRTVKHSSRDHTIHFISMWDRGGMNFECYTQNLH